MKKHLQLILLLSCFCFLNTVKAQLFIDDGVNGSIFIRNATGGTLAAYDNTNAGIALFIDGNFTIKGTYDNQSAETQLTGHINNTGIFTTSGDEVFVSEPNAIITTNINQRISGAFIATILPTVTNNEFNNLILHKPSTKHIDLASSIEVKNSIKFNNSGRIRTDIIGHADDGSAYPFEVYLKNGAVTSLVGNSTGNGAIEKYIEGKLRRKITATGTYYYPIGVAPTSLDGMEAFELNFAANPNMDFLGYIQPATQAPLYRNILCDIGKDPGPGVQNFSGCVGSPDGIYDWYYLEVPMDLTHEWLATPSGSTIGYNYGITLHPGDLLDVNNASNYYTIPNSCGTPYQTQRLRVVAKDGIVGGNLQSGPGNWAPFSSLTSYLWCEFDDADLDISLNSQTSFSKYRIHGTNLNSNTILPVELISLNAAPIDNQYIKVSWTTASELNNRGFEIWRSIDGINFNFIGFVEGNGTTNQLHNYAFDDHNVQAGIIYYYKLKQIDFNANFKFTRIVNAKLNSTDEFSINEIYPNPVTAESYINIYSPSENTLIFTIYNDIGQLITQNEIHIKKGNNTISLATISLAKATYIASFQFEGDTYTKKIIKI